MSRGFPGTCTSQRIIRDGKHAPRQAPSTLPASGPRRPEPFPPAPPDAPPGRPRRSSSAWSFLVLRPGFSVRLCWPHPLHAAPGRWRGRVGPRGRPGGLQPPTPLCPVLRGWRPPRGPSHSPEVTARRRAAVPPTSRVELPSEPAAPPLGRSPRNGRRGPDGHLGARVHGRPPIAVADGWVSAVVTLRPPNSSDR